MREKGFKTLSILTFRCCEFSENVRKIFVMSWGPGTRQEVLERLADFIYLLIQFRKSFIMASEKLILDIENAILEQNADLVDPLFKELKIDKDTEGKSVVFWREIGILNFARVVTVSLILIVVFLFRNINFHHSVEG